MYSAVPLCSRKEKNLAVKFMASSCTVTSATQYWYAWAYKKWPQTLRRAEVQCIILFSNLIITNRTCIIPVRNEWYKVNHKTRRTFKGRATKSIWKIELWMTVFRWRKDRIQNVTEMLAQGIDSVRAYEVTKQKRSHSLASVRSPPRPACATREVLDNREASSC